MARFVLLLAALGFAMTASAVQIGQSWDDVEKELGKPISKLDAPGRSIGRWADLEVIFEEGRVKSFLRRDLAGETASAARRKQDAETARKLREEIQDDQRRREEDVVAQAERDQAGRALKTQTEKVASLEAQLIIERKKLDVMIAKGDVQKDEDRIARMEILRKELVSIRLEIQRALSDGEVERAKRLQTEMQSKESELNLLGRKNR